jgi:hypothetical protein
MIGNGTNHAIFRHSCSSQVVLDLSVHGIIVSHRVVVRISSVVIVGNGQTGECQGFLFQVGRTNDLKMM